MDRAFKEAAANRTTGKSVLVAVPISVNMFQVSMIVLCSPLALVLIGSFARHRPM